MAAKPRVKVPKSVKAGEAFTIKTLISHKMETGLRKDKAGKVIPRKIINKFTAEFNGKPVFSADIHPSVSANPFFEFSMKISEAGKLKMAWQDDDGSVYEAQKDIAIA